MFFTLYIYENITWIYEKLDFFAKKIIEIIQVTGEKLSSMVVNVNTSGVDPFIFLKVAK